MDFRPAPVALPTESGRSALNIDSADRFNQFSTMPEWEPQPSGHDGHGAWRVHEKGYTLMGFLVSAGRFAPTPQPPMPARQPPPRITDWPPPAPPGNFLTFCGLPSPPILP